MYIRPNQKRQHTVPENYGGTAFAERDDPFIPPPSDAAECCEGDGDIIERRSALPIKSSLFNLDGEDLLLLGLIFLLAQSDMGNDIIPLLLILLLC